MAVPLTGPLSQLKLAREAKHADYNGSQSMGVISLYDLVNGGQANGSTVDYPTVNQDCLPNPANRSSLQLTTVVAAMGGGSSNYYYNSYFGNASNLAVGDQLFTNATLGSFVPGDSYTQDGTTGSTTICGNGQILSLGVGSNGLITSITCINP